MTMLAFTVIRYARGAKITIDYIATLTGLLEQEIDSCALISYWDYV